VREYLTLMLKEMRFASGLCLGVALGTMFGVLVGAALTVHAINLVK